MFTRQETCQITQGVCLRRMVTPAAVAVGFLFCISCSSGADVDVRAAGREPVRLSVGAAAHGLSKPRVARRPQRLQQSTGNKGEPRPADKMRTHQVLPVSKSRETDSNKKTVAKSKSPSTPSIESPAPVVPPPAPLRDPDDVAADADRAKSQADQKNKDDVVAEPLFSATTQIFQNTLPPAIQQTVKRSPLSLLSGVRTSGPNAAHAENHVAAPVPSTVFRAVSATRLLSESSDDDAAATDQVETIQLDPAPAAEPEATIEADQQTEADPRLPDLLHRPLSDVTLADALQPTDLDGTVLRTPDDQAATIYNIQDALLDSTVTFRACCRWRSLFPFCHNPLYFEDANMERCGIGYGCLTEMVSAGRFFGRVALLPASMVVDPPCSCVPSLGECPSCHGFPHCSASR